MSPLAEMGKICKVYPISLYSTRRCGGRDEKNSSGGLDYPTFPMYLVYVPATLKGWLEICLADKDAVNSVNLK